jgi:hypothetical protein
LFRLNERVLGALQLATEIDLTGVPVCPACLLELARKIRDGDKPSHGLIARTTDWIWMESGDSIKEAVLRARMAERPFADEALRDLELNGWRGKFAKAVVLRLAHELAEEMTA